MDCHAKAAIKNILVQSQTEHRTGADCAGSNAGPRSPLPPVRGLHVGLAVSCIIFDPPLDGGIRAAVEALQAAGIDTFESCEGGKGHSYAEPTVRFHGDSEEGLRALSVAIKEGLPVLDLRKVWPVIDNQLTGPWWELTFLFGDELRCDQKSVNQAPARLRR